MKKAPLWAVLLLPLVLAASASLAVRVAVQASEEPEAKFPNWQLVGAQAACFLPGEAVVLRTWDGETVNTVARLKVSQVDRQRNVVTFVERVR